METFAMWSGVAGIVVSLFAVIILFLTRKNILDILDKDVILFDKNFELKKQAIEHAMTLVDELENNSAIKRNAEFNIRAKKCYNELLCVVTNLKVANEFYSIALGEEQISSMRLIQFKIACRKDIGLNTKHTGCIKQNSQAENALKSAPNQPVRPIADVRTQPNAPILQDEAYIANPTAQQSASNIATSLDEEQLPSFQPAQRVVKPMPARAVRPVTTTSRVSSQAMPTQPVARPVVKRPTPPKDE